jgi:hypothetical protein
MTDLFTTDGVLITEGLRVFTNNLDRGVVKLDPSPYSDGWFDVILDTDYKGQPTTGRTMQNGERVTTRWKGQPA